MQPEYAKISRREWRSLYRRMRAMQISIVVLALTVCGLVGVTVPMVQSLLGW